MANIDEVNTQSVCKECKKLEGGNRHTPAHQFLVQTDFKPFPSQYGNVDEYYYKCSQCGKTWLHETGNYGQGWQ